MAAPSAIPAELGPDGQACPQCAEPLRSDQRYCLNCGRRRARTRLAFLEVVGADGRGFGPGTAAVTPAGSQPGAPAPAPAHERSPLVALGALLALLLTLGIGVLLGRGARPPEVAARAPIVNVAAAPAAGAATAPTPVASEWPAAKDGWTIQIGALGSTVTAAEVATAKRDAASRGAPAVGALRSDEFASLPAGQVVVYSGIFASKSAATKALKPLRTSFPQAKVVRVFTTAPAAGAATGGGAVRTAPAPRKSSGLSPSEYQKKSKKLPDEVKSEGAPPPQDGKAPGGGTGEATEIG